VEFSSPQCHPDPRSHGTPWSVNSSNFASAARVFDETPIEGFEITVGVEYCKDWSMLSTQVLFEKNCQTRICFGINYVYDKWVCSKWWTELSHMLCSTKLAGQTETGVGSRRIERNDSTVDMHAN
jgi:hypothetical protein